MMPVALLSVALQRIEMLVQIVLDKDIDHLRSFPAHDPSLQAPVFSFQFPISGGKNQQGRAKFGASLSGAASDGYGRQVENPWCMPGFMSAPSIPAWAISAWCCPKAAPLAQCSSSSASAGETASRLTSTTISA